jgi:hypothetical protein
MQRILYDLVECSRTIPDILFEKHSSCHNHSSIVISQLYTATGACDSCMSFRANPLWSKDQQFALLEGKKASRKSKGGCCAKSES